jgi:arylsulfatase A
MFRFRLCIISLTAFFLAFILGDVLAEDMSAPPNIVFLLIDDMGWPDVTCYGHQFHETPNIDRLCAEGMKFTDFYAATPVCSSTRSTIQSGQYSGRTAITDFIPGHWRPFEKLVVPPIEHQLSDDVQSPGEVLGAAGYATGYFGKWHVGPNDADGPSLQGYQMNAKTMPPEFDAWRETNEPGPKRMRLLTDQTMFFMEQNKDRPFFVTLSHHAVHIRLEANDETLLKYEEKPAPEEGVNNPAYAAMIEDLDDTIGEVLDKIDELGIAENTIVVFTSDNGGLRMIYTGVGEIVSTNAPLRDEKGTLYEGGIRVPMIVRWPGVTTPGSVSAEPTTTADLLPTFCEMAGVPTPDQPIDGSSIVSLLQDAEAELERDAIYFHYPHYHHSTPGGAIRMGDWKLVEFFDGSPCELYNLTEDIGESDDLADANPDRVSAMRRELALWREEVGARMPTVNPDYDPDRAADWWSRRTNEPLDIEAMERNYRTQQRGASR